MLLSAEPRLFCYLVFLSDTVACQELAVLQEELDLLVTRREDYETVSCTRTAWERASFLFRPIRVSVALQKGRTETCHNQFHMEMIS